MRISKKIGLSFFITFLLVILLGSVSIYTLRHIYRGLGQVFVKDLPASRSTYEIAISMEDVLSELNNFLITGNENFKISYEDSYEKMQAKISDLGRFISKEEERVLFEDAGNFAGDINGLATDIFEKKNKIKGLFKDITATGSEYIKKLDRLFDFEEKKMQGEKDFLLIQAQHIPASLLIMEARSRFSNLIDELAGYAMENKDSISILHLSDLEALKDPIADYKNYYGYSISDSERTLATELIDLSREITSTAISIMDLKKEIDSSIDTLFIKESSFTDALDNIIAIKKSGISSKLGIGATLTEDIPAIHNISKLEKDIAESWWASGRYMLTDSEVYKELYYQLRKDIDKEIKDYGRHTRLRGTEKFLHDIVEVDKNISVAIDLNMETFEKKKMLFSELISTEAGIEKKIEEILRHKDSLIKEAKNPQDVMDNLIPARWVLMRLKGEISNSSRAAVNYLNEQEAQYKDIYSGLYFDMKKYVNTYRNLSTGDKDLAFAKEIEEDLDRFNTNVLDIIDSHDKIVKDTGWTLVKLQDDLKDRLAKAVEVEIDQIEDNKEGLTKRIATINILIFFIIGVVAFIAVFVIFYTIRSITNPIQKLYDGAEIIGGGNLDYRLDIKTGDEIQDLAEGFNTMAGELKELYTNLENKVKERTAQLAEANQTLVFKKDELEKINLKLKELDRMKSDFVANVVHELRTPLTIIKGNIDTIEKGYAGKVLPKQKEILGDVFRVSNRLARLVNDLLDLSKIESGKMKLDIEDVDIIEVAKEATKGFERLASDKKVGLKREFPSRALIIKADRDKLTQVFINLMGNALKFTDKGDVVVKIIELQDEVQVELQDTGPGMTKEQVEKIFDKFVRVVAEKKEGTGLGLPIAKDIIRLHKGRIRVESEPGKGSTFIFNLPKK